MSERPNKRAKHSEEEHVHDENCDHSHGSDDEENVVDISELINPPSLDDQITHATIIYIGLKRSLLEKSKDKKGLEDLKKFFNSLKSLTDDDKEQLSGAYVERPIGDLADDEVADGLSEAPALEEMMWGLHAITARPVTCGQTSADDVARQFETKCLKDLSKLRVRESDELKDALELAETWVDRVRMEVSIRNDDDDSKRPTKDEMKQMVGDSVSAPEFDAAKGDFVFGDKTVAQLDDSGLMRLSDILDARRRALQFMLTGMDLSALEGDSEDEEEFDFDEDDEDDEEGEGEGDNDDDEDEDDE